jgi:hypothetical protein
MIYVCLNELKIERERERESKLHQSIQCDYYMATRPSENVEAKRVGFPE